MVHAPRKLIPPCACSPTSWSGAASRAGRSARRDCGRAYLIELHPRASRDADAVAKITCASARPYGSAPRISASKAVQPWGFAARLSRLGNAGRDFSERTRLQGRTKIAAIATSATQCAMIMHGFAYHC